MGFFDSFDGRKGIARWLARLVRQEFGNDAAVVDEAFVLTALTVRYSRLSPKGKERNVLSKYELAEVRSVFSLCHLFLEIELLSHLNATDRLCLERKGENIIEHTYGVADRELSRLGFGEPPKVDAGHIMGVRL